MELPKTIYMRVEEDDDEEYLLTFKDEIDCIEDDGPTLIGTYTLTSTDTLKKVVMRT